MYRAIAVGTDGSATAGEAVRRAARLAVALDVPLHVVSAYRPSAVMTWAGAAEAPTPIEALSECLAALEADTETLVRRTVGQLREQHVRASGHAVPGHPAHAILHVAAAEGADLIVVGNKGMHGARRVLGSIPNAISHSATCDVLIVSTT
jgi:nucleotide-binding universal stress UspA family protein